MTSHLPMSLGRWALARSSIIEAMPHITIEFSANTCSTMGGPTDIDGLVDAVHDAAIDSGLAPVDALRTRAVGRNHVAIADRHVTIALLPFARIGPGRSDEQRSNLPMCLSMRWRTSSGLRLRAPRC